jgi:hypothetical protein
MHSGLSESQGQTRLNREQDRTIVATTCRKPGSAPQSLQEESTRSPQTSGQGPGHLRGALLAVRAP